MSCSTLAVESFVDNPDVTTDRQAPSSQDFGPCTSDIGWRERHRQPWDSVDGRSQWSYIDPPGSDRTGP